MNFQPLPTTAALDDLTLRQAAFVEALLELGGKKGAAGEAALAAGYGNGDLESAKRNARELLRNPRVRSALHSELSNRFNASAVLGLKTLVELCRSGPPSVRLQAAKDLIDRGFGPIMSRSANLNVASTLEQYLDQVEQAQREGRLTIDGTLTDATSTADALK